MKTEQQKFTIRRAGYSEPTPGYSPAIVVQFVDENGRSRWGTLGGGEREVDVHVCGLMMATGAQSWKEVIGKEVLVTWKLGAVSTRVLSLEPLSGQPGEIYIPRAAMAFVKVVPPTYHGRARRTARAAKRKATGPRRKA